MKFIGLVSGGKDSIFSICKLIDQGHTLVALLHVAATSEYTDSYMYQTVGTEMASLLGKCFNVPIYVYKSDCKAVLKDLEYTKSEGDEVEVLYVALSEMLSKHQFEGVSSGAILSTYQKNRVENVCNRLNLTSLAPLWNRNQKELIQEMIQYGIDARIIKIASPFLNKTCLFQDLAYIREYYDKNANKYETNYCGEGGEYESIVLDCPHFVKKLSVGSYEICKHPEELNKDDGVYYVIMRDISIMDKNIKN